MRHVFLIFAILLSYSSAQADDQQKIVLIRHAQAENNTMHFLNSNPKHPRYKPCYLTPQGVRQVEQTAKVLKEAGIDKETVSLTVTSPLPRAIQTASELAQQGILSRETIIVDPRLTESQHGDKEGEPGDLNGWDLSEAHTYGGETYEDIRIRVKEALKEIGSQEHSGHVVIITHGTPAHELHLLLTGQGKKLGNAEVVILPMNQTRILTY